MKRCKGCCLWALPLALLLGLLFLPLAKGRIDSNIANRVRTALDAGKITGVKVKSNWGKVTLTGPASLEQKALAAAALMSHRGDAQKPFVYVGDGSAAPATAESTTVASTAAPTTVAPTAAPTTAAPATTVKATTAPTTAAPAPTTTVAPVSVDASVDALAKKITLSGFVANDAERKTLVDAATAAFGAPNVVDQLTVKAGTPAAGVEGAVGQLAKVIESFGTKVDTGKAHLVDTALTVSGTGFTTQSTDDANGVLTAAGGGGVKVTGTITAPAAPDPATLQARLVDLLGRSGINFDSGSAEITADSADILDRAAQSILAVPGVNIEVQGHTDNVGSAASNRSLSERRANAVRNYLIGKGVPAGQLSAAGFGDTQPVQANDTEEGRAANRRIEFKVQ